MEINETIINYINAIAACDAIDASLENTPAKIASLLDSSASRIADCNAKYEVLYKKLDIIPKITCNANEILESIEQIQATLKEAQQKNFPDLKTVNKQQNEITSSGIADENNNSDVSNENEIAEVNNKNNSSEVSAKNNISEINNKYLAGVQQYKKLSSLHAKVRTFYQSISSFEDSQKMIFEYSLYQAAQIAIASAKVEMYDIQITNISREKVHFLDRFTGKAQLREEQTKNLNLKKQLAQLSLNNIQYSDQLTIENILTSLYVVAQVELGGRFSPTMQRLYDGIKKNFKCGNQHFTDETIYSISKENLKNQMSLVIVNSRHRRTSIRGNKRLTLLFKEQNLKLSEAIYNLDSDQPHSTDATLEAQKTYENLKNQLLEIKSML